MEVKAPGGKQRPEQKFFESLAESCGETYVVGGLETALAHLRAIGVLGP